MKKLLLATTLGVFSTPTLADVITIGFADANTGGHVVTLQTTPGTVNQLLPTVVGQPLFIGTAGFGFSQIIAELIPPNQSGLTISSAPTFEFAFNNGFVPPQGGAIRLYATWQGATTAGGSITLPSIFQTNEMPLPLSPKGLTVTEQIFVCQLNGLFCDNALVGGGTLVGATTITDALLTTFPTFAGTAPGQPFAITEEFIFSQNRTGAITCPAVNCLPQGDVGAAILTTVGGNVTVPGPVVGAGLPGLMAGLMGIWGWRRRRQQLAA